MKHLDENLDLGLDNGQIGHDINQATLLEQDQKLLEEIKTFNGNLNTVHEDAKKIVQTLNLVKADAKTSVEYLEQALNPKPSYNLKKEFEKITDDADMMIIATEDGCMDKFNDNIDQKAREFGDVADKKMDEVIKRFKEATKDNKRMYTSSVAYYILLSSIVILAMFFACIIMVNIMRYHDSDLTMLICGFAASLIIAIGSVLFFHYKFGDE